MVVNKCLSYMVVNKFLSYTVVNKFLIKSFVIIIFHELHTQVQSHR